MPRLLPLLVVLSSCASERHVFVPNTPEAAACRNDCQREADRCQGKTMKGYLASSSPDYPDTCENARKDCLLTCPGAHETTPD